MDFSFFLHSSVGIFCLGSTHLNYGKMLIDKQTKKKFDSFCDLASFGAFQLKFL